MNQHSQNPANGGFEEPPQYLVAHVHEALATDERTSELHVKAKIVGDRVFLTGTVGTEERREAAEAVTSEILTKYEVINQIAVQPIGGESTEEIL